MGVSASTGGRPPHESVPEEVTASIMMTAAVVLFLLVIFVLVLHLYLKWFWHRVEEPPAAVQQSPGRGRRRLQHRQIRQFAFSTATHDNPTRKGLDSGILLSLPAIVVGSQELGDGLECAICLSELAEGEKARLLPKCNHGFHSDCIDLWFESHRTCPICRDPVDATDSSKSAEANVGISSSTGSSSSAGETVEENPSNGQPSESPYFPTNVLFWGNESQVSSRTAACLEEAPSSSSSAPSNNGACAAAAAAAASSSRVEGALAIDIRVEEPKSPVNTSTRLRSLKRLLSRTRG
ncbi:hypothetical protein SAY87_002165 [Trapa incisa]|uniref:RING-type E3 ubiquitin transferase n=1 Tax=Trapa incisa TaxID=236973 RepID=A0AAN7JUE9_9MYRT|nr:hypothetical protein SAY87_002165 [Trapa incisa]